MSSITTEPKTYTMELVSRPTYRINVPGFEHLEFSESSSDYLVTPAAVDFNKDFGGQLQSAREAWAVRLAANGANHANGYQTTRTPVIHFVKDGKVYAAFDDSNDPTENIILARAQEGYNFHSEGEEWLVSRNDPVVYATLERAIAAGRIAPVADVQERGLPLDGTYSKDATVNAILTDLAPQVEQFLSANYSVGRVWDLTAKEYVKSGVDSETVNIRRVGVGGYLVAGSQLYYGFARRVRENFQRK